MELLLESIKMDWPVLLPILVCSILVLGVVISKWSFYQKNQRDITVYMRELNRELSKNDLSAAQNIAIRCGGVIGEVIEEAVRIFSEQKNGFSRSFDISAALATRKLESHLTILGTIGGVAPFLGLFGTVVRILLIFVDMPNLGANSGAIASGIGSALIATAFGLGVAIVAVIFYNSFQSIVKHYEDDFQLIKLLFLSFVDAEEAQGTQKLFTEINITPLTDIFLVLLIIMMVIAPSFKSMDQAVEVPKVNNGATIEDAKVTVSITKDGQMYVNDEGTTSSQLTDKLLAAKGTNENAEVVVKADKAVKSATIMDVMNAAQNAEYKKLIVAGEPLSAKAQKDLNKKNNVNIPKDGE